MLLPVTCILQEISVENCVLKALPCSVFSGLAALAQQCERVMAFEKGQGVT